MVKKGQMSHLKTVSAGKDTSTNIQHSKRPGKQSGAALSTTHDNHMNAVAAQGNELRTILR